MENDRAIGADARADTDLLRRFWRALTPPGEVREVRIPKSRKGGPSRFYGTVSGYFDSEDRFVEVVHHVTGRDAEGVYITLNPVTHDLKARAHNRLETGTRTATADADIVQRTCLLIDIDPRRPSGISATEEEQAAAIAVRDRLEALLFDLWGTEPLYRAMTGNGGGLVYRIDLPNDPESLKLITSVLKALATQFDDDRVSIDQSVTNAARITKVIGTIAAKGDDTPELGRRWRRATAEFPANPQVVTREQLQMLAHIADPIVDQTADDTEPQSDDKIFGQVCNQGARAWTVSDLLKQNDIVAREVTKTYGTVYELDRCLTSTDHDDGAAIIEMKGGALAYRCHHNSCAERTWADVRSALGLQVRGVAIAPPIIIPNRSSGGQGGPKHNRPILTCVSDIEPESVQWLVPGRIPLGKICVLEGDPGLGKSTLLVDLAARMTTGATMPDGTRGDLSAPANVIMLSAEDGAGDTIRPRLQAAGADLARVYIFEAVEDNGEQPRKH